MASVRVLLTVCAILMPLQVLASDRDDVVRVVTEAYINGVHVKPDPAAMRRGFHPDFRMLVLADGKMTAVTLGEWVARIEQAGPSAPRPAIRSEIPRVEVTGTAATAQVELWRDNVHTFTDYLSLYRFADGWKIVGKTFYRHPAPSTK